VTLIGKPWNRKMSRLLTLAAAIASITACLYGHAQSGTGAFPQPGTTESLGMNIHFTDPRPGELKQMAAAGVRWVRMDYFWEGIEKSPGAYDFSAYDHLLGELQKYKIRPIYILDYGNRLYGPGSPRTPEAIAAFSKFAAASVSHFKGKGIVWEMWNEPNGGFWNPTANVQEYIALALATGKAIRAAAPREAYIGPATSGMDFNFIEACFKAGLLKYWDAVSFHPYRNTAPETAAADYVTIRTLIKRYAPAGKQVPILSGEWGYSELYPGLSRDLQAKYLAREYLTNLSNGLVVSIWYDWHDDGTDPKEPEHHFGSVFPDYSPKPAYVAAATLAKCLNALRFNKRLSLERDTDYCLLFTGMGGSKEIAAWTTALDDHDVTLPVSAGAFELVTPEGNVNRVHADSDGLQIRLTGAPIYLKPLTENRMLTTAALWPSLPPAAQATSQAEAAAVLRAALMPATLPADTKVRIENLTLNEEEGTTDRVAVFPSPSAALVGIADVMRWQKRRPGGMKYRVSLLLPGMQVLSQETSVDTTHPAKLLPAPPLNGVVPVTVENPTGAEIHGIVSAGTDPAILSMAPGATRAAIGVKASKSESGFRIRLVIKEGKETTLTQAPVTYQKLESFDAYRPGQKLKPEEYQVLPDGDPKVASRITAEIGKSLAGLPGGTRNALHISYQFDKGWKFLRVAPQASKSNPLAGEPAGLGMWVFGDGSGDILNLRYIDASGQTFQTSAGEILWKGWRWVTFSLNPSAASHWGGSNNGKITYPLALDTVALVDSPGGRGGKGEIWITDITLLSPN
jgi:polysaccharide biosynthesis protein PslG